MASSIRRRAMGFLVDAGAAFLRSAAIKARPLSALGRFCPPADITEATAFRPDRARVYTGHLY